MKYIRVKDTDIYDTTEEELHFVSKEEYLKEQSREKTIVSFIEKGLWCYSEHGDVSTEIIINQSDDIEDLFDGYVIHYDVCPPKFANRFFTTKEEMEVWADEVLKNKWDYKVYGVLWDANSGNIPSLKSAAKLTDKGWELV